MTLADEKFKNEEKEAKRMKIPKKNDLLRKTIVKLFKHVMNGVSAAEAQSLIDRLINMYCETYTKRVEEEWLFKETGSETLNHVNVEKRA